MKSGVGNVIISTDIRSHVDVALGKLVVPLIGDLWRHWFIVSLEYMHSENMGIEQFANFLGSLRIRAISWSLGNGKCALDMLNCYSAEELLFCVVFMPICIVTLLWWNFPMD